MKRLRFSSQSLQICMHRRRGLELGGIKHSIPSTYDTTLRRFYRPSCLACQDVSSYRQNMKIEERRRKEGIQLNPEAAKRTSPTEPDNGWELSVGIEIHAELDTQR